MTLKMHVVLLHTRPCDSLNGWLFSSEHCTADHVTLPIISCLLGIRNADDADDCRVWFISSLEDGGRNRIFMMVVAEESSRATEIEIISVLVVDNVYFSKCKQYTITSLGIGKGGCCKGSVGNPTMPYSWWRAEGLKEPAHEDDNNG